MMVVGLLYIAFIMFRYVSHILDLSKTFVMKGCWMLLKAFSASNENIMWYIALLFVYMVDYIDRFLYIEPSLYLWNEAYLFMVKEMISGKTLCDQLLNQ